MENTTSDKIISIVKAQKAFFASGATLDIKYRKMMLNKMLNAINKWEEKLTEALWKDLHKSHEEAYLTEISIVTCEIRNHIRHITKWAKRERRCSPLKLFPSRSYTVKELSGAAASQSIGRSYLCGMYSCSETVTICSYSIKSHR